MVAAVPGAEPERTGEASDAVGQQRRLARDIQRTLQDLLRISDRIRDQRYLKRTGRESAESFARHSAGWRSTFWKEILGKIEDPMIAANPRSRRWRETGKWTGYEVSARRLARRLCLGNPAGSQRSSARGTAPGGGGSARSGRASPGRGPDRRCWLSLLSGLCFPLGRGGFHRLRPPQPLPGRRPLPGAAAQGQPPQAFHLFLHHRPAPPDPGLAEDPSLGGWRADRLLWPQLRRQDRHESPGGAGGLCPLHLFRGFQPVDLEERDRRVAQQATCSPESTKCRSSAWERASTTRRWPI